MAYYLGFLKKSVRHVVLFRSIVKPKKTDMTYFVKIMGPYATWKEARNDLTILKRELGYKENPSVSERQRRFMCAELGRLRAGKKRKTRMTEKQLRDFCRKNNPGEAYHDQKFMRYMKELEKYVIGSAPYIATLAKAYDQLESAKDSQKEQV